MNHEIWESCGEFAAMFECMDNMFSRSRYPAEFAVHKHVPAALYSYEHELLNLCDALLPVEQRA